MIRFSCHVETLLFSATCDPATCVLSPRSDRRTTHLNTSFGSGLRPTKTAHREFLGRHFEVFIWPSDTSSKWPYLVLEADEGLGTEEQLSEASGRSDWKHPKNREFAIEMGLSSVGGR